MRSRISSLGYVISCFSALQRAENSSMLADAPELHGIRGFSALQRAENSSIERQQAHHRFAAPNSFSALQRAENSSNITCEKHTPYQYFVSVLFSEPKIPQ